jgi:crossover junction endodeoxyribonuclease RuvC|tara:strand:- start:444 stop:938 length:495 start_codon:yes stop_codon:yes gene_type:complete
MKNRVIGIDPGLSNTGYGVLDFDRDQITALEGGVCKTVVSDNLEIRLKSIFDDLREVVIEYKPKVMAVEDLHSRYRNLKTAIIMGHARGVVCLVASQFDIPVFSYQPTQIKNIVTGSGRADKIQIQRSVARLLNLNFNSFNEHVADAYAAAICYSMMSNNVSYK